MFNLETELGNYLADVSQDQDFDAAEAETFPQERELLALVSELGFSETPEMEKVRLSFVDEQPTELGNIRQAVNAYLEIGETQADLDPTSQSRLALNILLVLFYSPRQTEDIELAFEDAIYDVLIQTENEYPELVERVKSIFDGVSL